VLLSFNPEMDLGGREGQCQHLHVIDDRIVTRMLEIQPRHSSDERLKFMTQITCSFPVRESLYIASKDVNRKYTKL
jgi:hypothetical protein